MAVVPRIGTEFAGYRIEALLGRGGMSIVYRAENARLGNKVALKLLAEDLADDESFRERFVRESRTAAAINHPSIVTIYDAGDWEGVLYIAMRYVQGDLKELLKREGPLSIDATLAVVSQVGSALDAAHARGLLHRDVKPANILLDPPSEPGGAPHAYLADFGLTKHLESRSGITASGQFVGTIDYMSPEQIEGREVDGRTDIYSLGCVVFECLAGATPFQRETEVAVLWAHMRDDPEPVTELRSELPEAVDSVVAKAVAKSPDARYGTCRELVDDLRAALLGDSVVRHQGRGAADRGADASRRRPASSPSIDPQTRRQVRLGRCTPRRTARRRSRLRALLQARPAGHPGQGNDARSAAASPLGLHPRPSAAFLSPDRTAHVRLQREHRLYTRRRRRDPSRVQPRRIGSKHDATFREARLGRGARSVRYGAQPAERLRAPAGARRVACCRTRRAIARSSRGKRGTAASFATGKTAGLRWSGRIRGRTSTPPPTGETSDGSTAGG